MGLSKQYNAVIKGVVSVVPDYMEDNAMLDLIPENEREALITHTGIRFRRIEKDTTVDIEDYFYCAVSKLVEALSWDISTIDVLVCVTQNQSTPIPSIACKLHDKLDLLSSVLCYDINSGCSGFVYGLHTVNQLLGSLSKNSTRAILCCGDISSFLTESTDKTVRPVFSDAVSAIGVESTKKMPEEATGFFNLETFGKGKNAIYSEKGSDEKMYMRLNGIDIFNYSVKFVPNNVMELFAFAEKSIDDMDQFVFHQANKVINESIRRKLDLPKDKVADSLYDYGNTASASIPLTLNTSWSAIEKKSKWILISGFGVGFSVASALIYFDPIVCLSPINFVKTTNNE